MYVRLALFFAIVALGASSNSIPTSTIDADVVELTKLHREYLNRSPRGPSRRAYEIRCRAVEECCPSHRSDLYSLFSENQFSDQCIGNGTRLTIASHSLSCLSTIRQLIELTKEPIYKQYFELLGNETARMDRIQTWMKQMKTVCSTGELDAYYCERDNMEKFNSCQRKVLELVARESNKDNGKIYKEYVAQWEQEYAVDIQKLAKTFSNL